MIVRLLYWSQNVGTYLNEKFGDMGIHLEYCRISWKSMDVLEKLKGNQIIAKCTIQNINVFKNKVEHNIQFWFVTTYFIIFKRPFLRIRK